MKDDEPRGDLFEATQMLAADNARLCGIVIAADELAARAAEFLRIEGSTFTKQVALKKALDAYKVARQGQ